MIGDYAYLIEDRNRYLGKVVAQSSSPSGTEITYVKVGPNHYEVQAYTSESLELLPERR